MSSSLHRGLAIALLIFMFLLAGGAALHESATVDEIAHIGAGLSYVQKFDLRLNQEHPPLSKVIAGVSLALRGTSADYDGPIWRESESVVSAYILQWAFGDLVQGRWNNWRSTLGWARFPMLLLTLWLGWMIYLYAARLATPVGGLLCLAVYCVTPAFLVFGPLVITDVPVTLFSVIALWQLGEIWAEPSPRNSLLFGVAFAAAMLCKFTGLILFAVILALFLQTRFWPTAIEPSDKAERKRVASPAMASSVERRIVGACHRLRLLSRLFVESTRQRARQDRSRCVVGTCAAAYFDAHLVVRSRHSVYAADGFASYVHSGARLPTRRSVLFPGGVCPEVAAWILIASSACRHACGPSCGAGAIFH